MKAAVMYPEDGIVKYTDFPEPTAQNDNELVIKMRAAALKQVDKSRAKGTHYSTQDGISHATVIGGDGVGVLPDGLRVFAVGVSGMIAKKAVINKNQMVLVPPELDDVVAAALPNAVIGSAMGLRFKAQMKKGETVLINGATGFTGKIAVQLARHMGARKVIVTGRNEQALQSLTALGADELISLKQDDEAIVAQIKSIHSNTPIDVIIDYLWGHSAELLLFCLKGTGLFTHRTRFVSVGAMAGDSIQVSSENLRSVDLQLSGSGVGSWTQEETRELLVNILPEAFNLAVQHKLVVDTMPVALEDIEKLWDMNVPDGKRLVVLI